jgi:hypothetical protein
LLFSGKCQSKHGYRRSYIGKPGLKARLVSGPGRICFQADVTSEVTSEV